MSEKKSYYAIIPAEVRYCKDLTANAKLLYGELTALSNEKGFCWASNSYLCTLYEVSPQAISKWINQLSSLGFIKLEYIRDGKEIKQRNIYINTYQQKYEGVSTNVSKVSTNVSKVSTNVSRGYQQKVKENNTYINNTNNNTDNTTPKKTSESENDEYKNVIEMYNSIFNSKTTDCKTTRDGCKPLITKLKDYYKLEYINRDVLYEFFNKAKKSSEWMRSTITIGRCAINHNFLAIVGYQENVKKLKNSNDRGW